MYSKLYISALTAVKYEHTKRNRWCCKPSGDFAPLERSLLLETLPSSRICMRSAKLRTWKSCLLAVFAVKPAIPAPGGTQRSCLFHPLSDSTSSIIGVTPTTGFTPSFSRCCNRNELLNGGRRCCCFHDTGYTGLSHAA